MTYEKPEISVLGDATRLIQGSRTGASEPSQGDLQGNPDCELDD